MATESRLFMSGRNTEFIGLSAWERLYAALSRGAFAPALAVAYAGGASAAELRARTGRLPAAGRGAIWLHGASAGEMAAALRLIAVLRQHGYRFPAVLTAANRAGVDYVLRVAAPDTFAALVPWDVPRWIRRAFDLWQPAALFLIETELWPRLVFEAHRRGRPVLALSARIYPGDMPRYRAIRSLIAPTIRRLSRILAQNETERARFITLGADAQRCVAAGNLKALPEIAQNGASVLRDALGLAPAQPLVVFGSVHNAELPLVFDAIAAVRTQQVRFVVAPRHRRDASVALRQASARGLAAVLRSRLPPGQGWRGVLVLDTMGELRNFYAIATLAVIGGGFGKFGGHNPFEALHSGVPVLFGAHFAHFEHEARRLMAVTPEAVVSSPEQLAARLRSWLQDEGLRNSVLALQRRTLPDAAAVTRRYLDELGPFLTADHA
jgi:3-deoxy-D-manno-octulosonic-acid transferase